MSERMDSEFKYDDTQLQRLFVELEPKRRMQALRAGFRKQASKVRKVAVRHLRAGLKSNKDLEKGVRAIVYKRTAGFRVTVGTGRRGSDIGFHKNRRGLKKPVLIWAEKGTKKRHTQSRKSKHYTGFMKRYGFLAKAKEDMQGKTTENIHRFVVESVIKTAKKYGCK